MAKPLEGIRVLEIGHMIAGPFCAMLLGDMGADVIKIERTKEGDHARVFLPMVNGESTAFAGLNRNKRSIAVDLKHPEGRDIVLKLAQQSDVVLENNRPGALEKIGLGAEHVRAVKPDIVYVSVSGFGQNGPYRSRAGVNFIIEAFSGSLSITGEPDKMPMRPGLQTADILGAMFATYAVLSGLLNVARNKDGRTIDVALVDASVAAAVWETAEYLTTGEVPQRIGHRHRVSTPSQLFETCDGYIAISAANDELFRRFMTVLGLESYLTHPKLASHVLRKQNEDFLLELVDPVIKEWTAEALEAKLVGVGLACSRVNDYRQLFDDPHVKARGLVTEVEHPRIGRMKTVRNAVRFDKDGPDIHRPAPMHGEHTVEVLRALGYDSEHIARLVRNGVVMAAAASGRSS